MPTEKEIEIIRDESKRHGERLDNITQLIDKDRSSIDQNTIDIDSIKKGQEIILKQMIDFKQEIRQEVRDVISEEVPKAVKKAVAKELTTISLENPRKSFVRHVSLWQSIINFLNRNK